MLDPNTLTDNLSHFPKWLGDTEQLTFSTDFEDTPTFNNKTLIDYFIINANHIMDQLSVNSVIHHEMVHKVMKMM